MTNVVDMLHRLIEWAALGIELLAVAVIVAGVVMVGFTRGTVHYVSVLGVLVLVRTLLSWSLSVEMEGRWPWQKGAEAVRSP